MNFGAVVLRFVLLFTLFGAIVSCRQGPESDSPSIIEPVSTRSSEPTQRPATATFEPPTATPNTKANNLKITEPFTIEMVLVPAGEFLMGSDSNLDTYAGKYDQPQHTIELPDYYIGKHEITNIQYAAFVEATGHRTPFHWKKDTIPVGEENHPVVWVSWEDVTLFTEWLSGQTGMDFHLPSEAEWEKACRGTDGRIYPWGNSAPNAEMVNYNGNLETTTQVGSYSPQGNSPYDLSDMAGNVWEWTSSLFADYPYVANDGREDMEARDRRVMRGGAFFWGDPKSVRCTERDADWMVAPSFRDDDVGFRIVFHP